MISVLILTWNEEQNLPACLRSVDWSDDIIVFDSFSNDRTIEIARQHGARVLQRKFDNERSQREASLKVGFRYPWVYNPDADEITTPELRDEMLSVVADRSRNELAYRVRFKTMFMGGWIRRSSLYPTWVVRLFKPEAVSFERQVNLRYRLLGREGFLRSHFEHYSFNQGLNAWFDKHNRYSWQEADETLRSRATGRFRAAEFLSTNPVARRRALKELSFRAPCRPLLRFLYMYVARLGFLDGVPGYHYCRLLAIYEYMIVLKTREILRRRRGLGM